jgi:hypothetical protein
MQMIQLFKVLFLKAILILFLVLITNFIRAENYLIQESLVHDTTSLNQESDTLSKKELRKKRKADGIKMLKTKHSRFLIQYDYVFADLNTRVTFSGPNEILKISLGLENNLGLPSKASFSSLSFVYRITKRSGFYTNYYGINREKIYTAQQELVFLGDTISAGASLTTYFNTHIVSAGYIFSALTHPDAYLGFYVNLYLLYLKTGFRTIDENKSQELVLAMPLPNFGFIGSFKLTKRLIFYGSIGVFSLNTKDYGGMINSFSIGLGIAPTRWIAVNLSYKDFNIKAYNNVDKEISAVVEYNFKGPSIGLTFKF